MEKHLKEMGIMVGKNFELIWNNDLLYIRNLAKEFYKKHCKRIDWPAYNPDQNLIENIWNIIKSRLNQISTSKILKLFQK